MFFFLLYFKGKPFNAVEHKYWYLVVVLQTSLILHYKKLQATITNNLQGWTMTRFIHKFQSRAPFSTMADSDHVDTCWWLQSHSLQIPHVVMNAANPGADTTVMHSRLHNLCLLIKNTAPEDSGS